MQAIDDRARSAMASGVPVVASNRPALAEIASGAALLVDPESIEELGDALRRLACDTHSQPG